MIWDAKSDVRSVLGRISSNSFHAKTSFSIEIQIEPYGIDSEAKSQTESNLRQNVQIEIAIENRIEILM